MQHMLSKESATFRFVCLFYRLLQPAESLVGRSLKDLDYPSAFFYPPCDNFVALVTSSPSTEHVPSGTKLTALLLFSMKQCSGKVSGPEIKMSC